MSPTIDLWRCNVRWEFHHVVHLVNWTKKNEEHLKTNEILSIIRRREWDSSFLFLSRHRFVIEQFPSPTEASSLSSHFTRCGDLAIGQLRWNRSFLFRIRRSLSGWFLSRCRWGDSSLRFQQSNSGGKPGEGSISNIWFSSLLNKANVVGRLSWITCRFHTDY